jgi:exosortase
MQLDKKKTIRLTLFFLYSFAVLIFSYSSLKELVGLSLQNKNYSHIPLIPVISGCFLYMRRKKIFSDLNYSYGIGIVMIIIGSLLYLIGMTQGAKLNWNDIISLMIFSELTLWVGGFLFCFGLKTLRNVTFPILFLLFMVPAPTVLIDRAIFFLQVGSTEAAYVLFKLAGTPVVRQGFVFDLTGMSVEVAKQCSGIRSSIALLIVGILSSVVFLKTDWKRLILILAVVPLAVIKNGLRIVTLSLFAIDFDSSILIDSTLHERGGILFFLIALIPFAFILWILERTESNKKQISWN